MAIYFIYYGIIGFSALGATKLFKKRKKIFQFLILFTGLFLILSLRHPIMGDDLQYGNSEGYLGRFQFIVSANWNTLFQKGVYGLGNYEIGYIIFNKLIGYISNSYQWLLICVSFLALFPVFLLFRKESDSFEFSIIIYMGLVCFLACFSALRQVCAIGICMIAFYFVKKKKIVPFILFVLLAFSFHSTAILFLLVYPFYWIKINKTGRLATLIILGGIFIFRNQLFNLLVQISGRRLVADYNGAFGFFLFLVIIYVLLFIFSKPTSETDGLMNILFLLCVCQCFGNLHLYIARIGYYFMPFLALLIPNSIKTMEKQTRCIVATCFVVFFVSYGLYAIYSSGLSWPQAYPWIPFWNEQ